MTINIMIIITMTRITKIINLTVSESDCMMMGNCRGTGSILVYIFEYILL
jgi:hypothetical protein